MPFF
jgi:hypothetical protein